MDERIYGFDPVVGDRPRILVLGSMPSVKSLEDGQYYAHPRNAFWRIQAALFEEDFTLDYALRLERLKRHGIALWDSAASCVRKGSLDSAISKPVPNDIPMLLRAQPTIHHVFFNGRASQRIFLRFYKDFSKEITMTALPSTSPAAASLSFDEKLSQWRYILDFL